MIEEVGSANTVGFSCGVERNVDFVLHQQNIYKSVNQDVGVTITLIMCPCKLYCKVANDFIMQICNYSMSSD
jgi:hypothetical protein